MLYIDDLFKTGYAQDPSAADVGIAFDIFNHRYINDMITIISSERGIEDINDIDAAIGGRIYEKTEPNGYYIGIQKDINKNYRINGQKKSLRHPKNKVICAMRYDVISASYHHSTLTEFRNTHTSSVEWAAEKL